MSCKPFPKYQSTVAISSKLSTSRLFYLPVPKFSFIIPAYNEGHRFPLFLEKLSASTLANDKDIEWLVVEDGSSKEHVEKTQQAMARFQNQHPQGKWQHLVNTKNQGKGGAIASGFQRATSPFIGFMDADASTEFISIEAMMAKFLSPNSPDVLIASRVNMLGMRITRLASRHYIGRVFATFVSVLFDIPVYDSQCGCKMFQREKLLPLLPKVMDQRWVWDTQLLVLCFKNKMRVEEFPVHWHEVPGSKVSMIRDPLRMAWSLIRFKLKGIH